MTVGALEACSIKVSVTVGAVSATGQSAVFAGSACGAVLTVVATVRGPVFAVGIVTTALAVALIVAQQRNGAQIKIPAFWKSDAIAVVVWLVEVVTAHHAVILAIAVFAVVKVGARLAGVVRTVIRAQSAVFVAASKFGTLLTFGARAAVVVSIL